MAEVSNELVLNRLKTIQKLQIETTVQKYEDYSLIKIQYEAQYNFIAEKKKNGLMNAKDPLLKKLNSEENESKMEVEIDFDQR